MSQIAALLASFKLCVIFKTICDALRYLVPFVQFKKREKHARRSVTFSKVAGSNNNKMNSKMKMRNAYVPHVSNRNSKIIY